jgi:ATP-dependent DNA helicase RecQ
MRFLSGQVKAVIVRRREDSEPEYHAALRCDRWEVVLPELVFEPEA